MEPAWRRRFGEIIRSRWSLRMAYGRNFELSSRAFSGEKWYTMLTICRETTMFEQNGFDAVIPRPHQLRWLQETVYQVIQQDRSRGRGEA